MRSGSVGHRLTRTASDRDGSFLDDHPMIQYNRVLRARHSPSDSTFVETLGYGVVQCPRRRSSRCWLRSTHNYWHPTRDSEAAPTEPATLRSDLTHLVNGTIPITRRHQCIPSGESMLEGISAPTGSLDIPSNVTGTTRHYDRLRDIRRESRSPGVRRGCISRRRWRLTADGEGNRPVVPRNFFATASTTTTTRLSDYGRPAAKAGRPLDSRDDARTIRPSRRLAARRQRAQRGRQSA